MLTDEALAALIEPLINIYQSIEDELLINIAKRFDTYEIVGGSLEWQLRKLDELGSLNADALEVFAKYSKKSKQAIKKMIEQASLGNFNMKDLEEAAKRGKVSVNLDKMLESPAISRIIKHGYKELDGTFRLIKTKALESSKQHYMDIINQSYLETSSGIYSYSESIRKGVKKMADKGISGATYKRKDGTIVHYSIEAAVRRDTLTAVNQTACAAVMESVEDIGAEHVEVSSHLGARVSDKDPIADHAGWQGKVYKVHGKDDEYDNLVDATGYGSIEGLAGVNCRHRMFPFFVGISKPAQVQYDSEENKKAYELSQKQRQLERKVRAAKREVQCMKALGDEVGLTEAKVKQQKAVDNLVKFCNDNDLKRDGNREHVENSANHSSMKRGYTHVEEEYNSFAKPGEGRITMDDGYILSKHENEKHTADWLLNTYGGNIHLLKEVDIDKIKTPDFLWNEKLWDLKNISTAKAAESAVRKGLKQISKNPGGIILDVSDNTISFEDIMFYVNTRMNRSKNFDIDIIVKNHDSIKIVRYKK